MAKLKHELSLALSNLTTVAEAEQDKRGAAAFLQMVRNEGYRQALEDLLLVLKGVKPEHPAWQHLDPNGRSLVGRLKHTSNEAHAQRVQLRGVRGGFCNTYTCLAPLSINSMFDRHNEAWVCPDCAARINKRHPARCSSGPRGSPVRHLA